MVDINFLKDIEIQLENELGGKVIIAKMVGYIGRLKKVSKKWTKRWLSKRIDIMKELYIVYEDSDCEVMVELLNVLYEEYKGLIEKGFVYLIKVDNFDMIRQDTKKFDIKKLVC